MRSLVSVTQATQAPIVPRPFFPFLSIHPPEFFRFVACRAFVYFSSYDNDGTMVPWSYLQLENLKTPTKETWEDSNSLFSQGDNTTHCEFFLVFGMSIAEVMGTHIPFIAFGYSTIIFCGNRFVAGATYFILTHHQFMIW